MSIGGSRTRDRGASFIELLVSVVILGTSGLAVLTTVSVTARGAAEQREISDAQSWLATIGGAVTDVDSYYRDCSSQPDPSIIAAEYETNIVAPIASASPSAPTIDVVAVGFWNSSTEAFGSSCRFLSHGDRLQQVTLQTTIAGETRSLSVVKRPSATPTVGTLPPPPPPGGGLVVPDPNPDLP